MLGQLGGTVQKAIMKYEGICADLGEKVGMGAKKPKLWLIDKGMIFIKYRSKLLKTFKCSLYRKGICSSGVQ